MAAVFKLWLVWALLGAMVAPLPALYFVVRDGYGYGECDDRLLAAATAGWCLYIGACLCLWAVIVDFAMDDSNTVSGFCVAAARGVAVGLASFLLMGTVCRVILIHRAELAALAGCRLSTYKCYK
jgi:hypothetical protein